MTPKYGSNPESVNDKKARSLSQQNFPTLIKENSDENEKNCTKWVFFRILPFLTTFAHSNMSFIVKVYTANEKVS